MNQLVNFRLVFHLISSLVIGVGVMMLFSLSFSIINPTEGVVLPIILSSAITIGSGFLLRLLTKPEKKIDTRVGNRREEKEEYIKKRDSYLIVALGWFFITFFSTLPYLMTGAIPSFTDAFFETISGLSTTGSTILDNIESLPKEILLWRSMSQWIGGMGIIVLAIAILPLLGVGGMDLFASEAPGPTKDKVHPRIKETAKRLWLIYLALTIIQTMLLWIFGMSLYDALNHALTTMSTGGFSPKQDSVAFYENPILQYIVILFMFIAGTNFTLLYFAAKFKFKRFLKNDEFRWYFLTVIGFTILVAIYNYINFNNVVSIEKGFRDALFQVVSIITTTGYATYDFTLWGPFITFIFFLLLFTGASAGSTSGGFKLVRIIILMKNGFLEFKRRLHPNAIVPVTLNGEGISPKIIYNLLAFMFFYIFMFTVGSLLVTFLGVEFKEALSAVATSLGNVGPGIGSLGPAYSFSALPSSVKWILSLLMMMGRLELFTVAVIFTPYFWQRI